MEPELYSRHPKNPKLQPHIDFLSRAWKPKRGRRVRNELFRQGQRRYGPGDDTLLRFGCEKDLASVLRYEEKDHFRCFELEANPSISANIHVLNALTQAGFDQKNSSINKVLTFLRKAKGRNAFWVDKWHSSPYYSTSHAVIACVGLANDEWQESVQWLLSTQNKDGSWGTYLSTAEETAYALQALWVWNDKVAKITKSVFKNGERWFKEHIDGPYPPLWIGKCLITQVWSSGRL